MRLQANPRVGLEREDARNACDGVPDPDKQAVINDRGTVQNFEVVAVPGQPARGGHLAEIDREISAAEATPPRARQTAHAPGQLRTIRAVVDAEQYIPAQVNLRAQILAPGGGTGTPVGAPPVANAIDTDWTRYHVRAA